MNSKVVLLLCACLFAGAYGASFQFTPQITASNPVIEITSDWIFVRTSQAPTGAVTLSISATPSSSVTFSTSTLSFSPSVQTASFNYKTHTTDLITISFTVTDANGDGFVVPNDILIAAAKRGVTIDAIPTYTLVNLPTEPLKITLQFPSSADLTFTPHYDEDALVFVPTAVTIPAGSSAGSYVAYFNTETVGFVAISWNIAGTESDWYGNVSSNPLLISSKRTVHTPTFANNVLIGEESGVLIAYIDEPVNTSFSVAVQAADTTFTPSVLTFSPGVQMVNFTFNTTTPATFSPKIVTYTITDPADGSNEYAEPANDQFTVIRETITVVAPSVYIQNKETHLSIRIPAPVVSDVTVWLYAANVNFNPTNVTFSGETTSFDVAIFPFAQGPDVFSFAITGTVVDFYDPPGDVIGVSVTTGQFIGPDSWYIPALTVGIQSDRFPVAVNVAPDTEVTLIPTSPDLIFTPTQATFTKDTVEQYFTITPAPANTASAVPAVTTTTIDFIVTGDQATLFAAPSSLTATISRRNIQIVWSPHIYTDNDPTATLYLQKNYIVWATANYVDVPVSVTPVSPYLTFNPPVLQFTPGQLRVKFTATVTGVAGDSSISYIISGPNGGLYANIPDTAISTQLRPLYISEAVIAPDDRVAGRLIVNPSAADLASDHVYSFNIQSPAIPEGSLNIIPHSNHVTFGPSESSISSTVGYITTTNQVKTINAGYSFYVPNKNLLANFTLTPLASGVFEVWFELTGPDAPYYAPPPHTWVSFFIEERPAGEILVVSKAAPSTFVATSLIFSLVLTVVALVL